MASRWPSCLRAIAATAILVKDADKLTMGQNVTIVAPHALESVIQEPPDRWMTNARMTHYQSLLLTERVTFAQPAILNPATLLPEADETPIHRCEEILAEETGTQSDSTDQPWPGVMNWFTDGSSFVVEGKHKAGAAVVDRKSVIWASSLPEGTSAQKAELITLTQTLRLAEGKAISIYTDSRYAFATAHVHGAIYQQHGLLTSAEKDIKNKEEILSLLEATQGPLTLMVKTSSQLGMETSEKQTLTEEEGLEYLTTVHHLTHLGRKKNDNACQQVPIPYSSITESNEKLD